MVYSLTREPYIKRLQVVIDHSYGIQTYGRDGDNLYPQRADEVRSRSFTLKSAVDRLCDFIKGQGFEDQVLSNLIVNKDGQTANEILDIIAQDKAPFVGFALHVCYNPFTYKITEIRPLDWMFCRLGLPDERGNVSEIKYNINWEMDSLKTPYPVFEAQTYPVFNPDPTIVKAQMDECGWQNYTGQILYWTPKPGVYPKCRFDAVFDNAQTQAEIGVAELYGIQNKFSAQHIFKYPGKFETTQKYKEFQDKISEFKGAEGTNSMMVVENPAGENGQELNLIESIQMQNTDKMYEFTSKDVRNAIRETLAIPAPILGQLPENGMFNQQQIEDSYKYVNAMTQGDRDQLERVFKKLFQFWNTSLTISSFKIKQLQYGVDGSQTSVTPGQPGDTTQSKPEPSALAGLTGKQDQNLRRIQRMYDRGTLTKERAIAELKLKFGLNDTQALSLLDDDTTNDAV
jgi:hypothetical protein